MKKFLLAAFLATVFCLSAALCSSASTSATNSGWGGQRRFTVVSYYQSQYSIGGTAIVSINKHNTFCGLLFTRKHSLSGGTVFTAFITSYFTQVNAGKIVHSCLYSERDDTHAPIKIVGHVSQITVRSVIVNAPLKSYLALRPPNKYEFRPDDPEVSGIGDVSYSTRDAKAVHRAEASGKAVTVRMEITKGGKLRHLGFVR